MLTLDEAITDAIALSKDTSADSLDSVYKLLDDSIIKLSEELDVATLLPGGAEAALHVAAKKADGRAFFEIFKRRVIQNICAKNGEFGKLIRAGLQGSVGATATALATALTLPAAALGIVVPLAVLISHIGLEAFCEMHDPKA